MYGMASGFSVVRHILPPLLFELWGMVSTSQPSSALHVASSACQSSNAVG
jgi:hypothetical protein